MRSRRATIASPRRTVSLISLARYTTLLARRDMRLTFAASVLGRLPIGMTGLAILLLVQSTTSSFAKGGAATGCYVAGLAIVAPAIGRLIDRYGPRLTLTACALLFPAALGALVASVHFGTPAMVTLLIAAAAGATFPPITVCMRTFLKRGLAESDGLLAAGYSLESVLIEIVFIVGPMLVALFVAFSSADTAVVFAAACGLVGSALFLRSPALRAWQVQPRPRSGLLGPLAQPGFLALTGVILCYSMSFGLLEIGITSYASEIGRPALAGVLLGLMSAGSAAGGLAYGSRSWRLPLTRQFATMLAIMGLGLGVLALGWPPWLFAVLCVVAGVVMAPALIIQSMLVGRTARAEHSTEAFTWSSSALLAGVGLGLALGGAMLEVMESPAVLIAAAMSALVAAVTALLALPR
jgi:MFS family permease